MNPLGTMFSQRFIFSHRDSSWLMARILQETLMVTIYFGSFEFWDKLSGLTQLKLTTFMKKCWFFWKMLPFGAKKCRLKITTSLSQVLPSKVLPCNCQFSLKMMISFSKKWSWEKVIQSQKWQHFHFKTTLRWKNCHFEWLSLQMTTFF